MNNEIRNNRKLKGVRIMLWYTVKDFWKCFLVLSWKLPWKNPIFRENFLKLFIKCSCYFYVTFQEFFTKLFKTFFLKSGVFLGINFSWIFLETFQENFMATKWSTLQESISKPCNKIFTVYIINIRLHNQHHSDMISFVVPSIHEIHLSAQQ